MNVIETEIADVKIIEPRVFGDDRGFFFESYNKDRYQEHGINADFVQDNVSFSSKGVLRGLHFQNPNSQGKLVSVLKGEVYDVAVDVRKSSPTFGKWVGVTLSAENKKQFWVPKGFAHGFLVTSETALFSYKCDDNYNPNAEHSLIWNDPDIGIDWPMDNPLVSPKDEAGLKLSEIEKKHLPE